ncbi:MAG: restriction endonuclease subunit S [Cyanobacteria bacterium]|nr:restriction endonuclease subunit S [Cyanobacteriota bacterium]
MNLLKYDRYKDSGVEWLGEIPDHWEILRTKNIFRLSAEPAEKNNNHELLSVYSDIGVKPRRELEERGNKASTTDGYWIVKKGDVIVNKLLAWMGAIGVSYYDGVTSPAYDILRAYKPIDSKFYHYLFRSPICLSKLKQHSKGIMEMRLRLYFDEFGNIKLPYPCFEEQKRIVEFLDRKCGEIDEAIAKKQRLIELLEEQKTILINQAVTKGLNPDAPMKDSGIEWLGAIPEHWEIKKAKHLFKQIIDTEHKTAPSFENGLYFIVRTSNVKNGKLVLDKALYTNEDIYKQWTKRAIPKAGDILFTREAPAGEACILPLNTKALIGQRMVLMKVNQSILDSNFAVFSIYGGAAKQYIYDLSVGSTVPHFNMSDIKNIPFVLPEIAEQRIIKEYLNKINDNFQLLQDKENKAIEKLTELKQILIAEAVTGKIKV